MTLIIAEAGVNHNGDPKIAFALIDEAKKAGADIVKFQTFKAKNLVIESANKANYQISNRNQDETQADMLRKLELPYPLHQDLLSYCEKIGIQFLSTAFDSESLKFLANALGLRLLKIPSGELTNAPFVLEYARTGCPLIVSTGMASLAEIEFTLGVIAFGYLSDSAVKPSIEEFQRAYSSEKGQAALHKNVTLLHCTSEYPTPFDSVNLNVIRTLEQAFGLPVGYSDHTEGIAISIAAVAKGSVVIEKHFTLDKQMEGPDHKSSLEPREFSAMVSSVRAVERALGSAIKAPSAIEVENKIAIRKSLVAARDIESGELFTPENLAIKRPGSGIAPIEYWRFVGSVCQNQYRAGDIIID